MRRLLDPVNTVAVILGAHDWTKAGLPVAPSFRRSAEHCHRYLLTNPPKGLGLQPSLVLNLFDDLTAASSQLIRISETVGGLVRAARQTACPVRDVLIYYIGHGICEGGKQLHLLVRDSHKGIEEQSSIETEDLAGVLRVAAPQQRRLVILDCCFSETAVENFGAMGALDEAVAATAGRALEKTSSPERGTLLLCSSPRNRASIGAPASDRTLFTGTLLSVLAEGSQSCGSEMLSFADLREVIWDRMLGEYGETAPRPALHQPDQSAGDLTQIPAFPNVARSRQTQEKTPVNDTRVAPGAIESVSPKVNREIREETIVAVQRYHARSWWRRALLFYSPTQPAAWFPQILAHVLMFLFAMMCVAYTRENLTPMPMPDRATTLSVIFTLFLLFRGWAVANEYYPVSNQRHSAWRWWLLLYVPLQRNGLIFHYLFWIWAMLSIGVGIAAFQDGWQTGVTVSVSFFLTVLAFRGIARRFECRIVRKDSLQ